MNLNKVVLCIGTSKCIGDSLGPMVGENLCRKINKANIYVFGNLKNNITYQNVDILLSKINRKIQNPYLILVDSALANKENIGKIVISKNKTIIGSALSKSNYKFGNISIKGIVGENKDNNIKNYNILNNVSKNLIQNLSNKIQDKIMQYLYV